MHRPTLCARRRAAQAPLRVSVLVMVATLMSMSLTAAAGARAAEPPANPTAFTGHWVLDPKKSDMPAPGGMRGDRGGPGGRRGEGGMGGGTGGPPPGGGMGGGMGGPPPGDREGGRRGPGGFLRLPEDMVVELADSEVTVFVRGLPVRHMRFVGGSVRDMAGVPPTDTIPSLPARWDGGRIVATAPTRRGTEIEERWELSKDGKQLIVKTALPAMAERPALELKRVYDRAEGD